MNSLLTALIFLVLALAGVVIRKTYFALPLRELKRRAVKHDQPAEQLYRAAAYGQSLRTLLWLYIGLTSAIALVLLARNLSVVVSILVVGPLLWIAFSLIPATRTTAVGIRLTSLATPLITWLLNYLHPMLSRGADLVENRYKTPVHTGIFEREDVIDLMKRQKHQPDNRLTEEEIDIISRVLKFEDYTVGSIMVPRSEIKVVLADDTIGPILIDELHQTGQDFALVRASRKGEFIGSLAFHQLTLESTGKVGDTMQDVVYYVHEADSLSRALHAFFTTNHPVFVVVNSSEEYVGVLTINSLLKQLLGHIPGEDFDQYADPVAVAARHSQQTPVKTDDEVVE